MARIGIVVGLRAEGDCLTVWPADDRPDLRCSGARPEVATRAAEDLVSAGCRGLVSFGLAGGLSGALEPGDLILADRVVVSADRQSFACDGPWRQRLESCLEKDTAVTVGPLFGSDRALPTPAAKRAVAADTGALAVDMESHRVATVARDARIPFVSVRAICDGCDRTVPDWLAGTIREDGRPQAAMIAAGLARRPWDLLRLVSLAFDARRGYATLRRVALGVGPLFQFQIDR